MGCSLGGVGEELGSLTVGEVQELLCCGHVSGDSDIAPLLLGYLEKLAREGIGVRLGAGAVGQLRLGRHGGVGGVKRGLCIWYVILRF